MAKKGNGNGKDYQVVTVMIKCDLCGREIEFTARVTPGPGVTQEDMEKGARELGLKEHKKEFHEN